MHRFGNITAGHPSRPANGSFLPAASRNGLPARLTPRFKGLGTTPAVSGLFQSGRVVAISPLNLTATNIRRG